MPGRSGLSPVRTEAAKAENVINVKENMFDDDPADVLLHLGGRRNDLDGLWAARSLWTVFVYIPRNDDNFIRIGDEYELFYHDGPKGWVSLGRQTVQEPVLRVQGSPWLPVAFALPDTRAGGTVVPHGGRTAGVCQQFE